MKIGLKKNHRGYRTYIRGTQKIGIHYNDIRIFLYGTDNKLILPIKKFDVHESSIKELNELSIILKLDII